jgi:VCBS repeat-containing protein
MFMKKTSPDQIANDLIDELSLIDPEKHVLDILPIEHAYNRASETSRITCQFAYKMDRRWLKTGDKLTHEYYVQSSDVVKQQLKLAGRDIAAIINRVAHEMDLESVFFNDEAVKK